MNQQQIEARCRELVAVGILERQVGVAGNLWQPTPRFTARVSELMETLHHPVRETREERLGAAVIQAMMERTRMMEEKSAVESLHILGAWFK